MPNERKIQIVKNLKEKLAKVKGLILTNYQGLRVSEVEALRRSLNEAKADYQVVKNTLLKLALKETSYQLPATSYQLTGPTAVVLSYEDEIKPLKILSDFAKEHEALKIKGGFFEGVWTAAAKLKEIALLPSREELMAKLLGVIQSPIARLASVGKVNQIGLVRVLKARSQNDK